MMELYRGRIVRPAGRSTSQKLSERSHFVIPLLVGRSITRWVVILSASALADEVLLADTFEALLVVWLANHSEDRSRWLVLSHYAPHQAILRLIYEVCLSDGSLLVKGSEFVLKTVVWSLFLLHGRTVVVCLPLHSLLLAAFFPTQNSFVRTFYLRLLDHGAKLLYLLLPFQNQ